MPDVHDLGLMIDSHVPLIVVETRDEPSAMETLSRLSVKRRTAFYVWTATEGIKRQGFGFEIDEQTDLTDPEKLLEHITSCTRPTVYALCDFHPYLRENQPKLIRLVKDIAQNHSRRPVTLLFISHAMELPPEVRHLSAKFKLSMPNEQQLRSIIQEEARRWSQANDNARVRTDHQILGQLINSLRGLTHAEARRLARAAITDDGAITADDLPEVNKAKFELMDMGGVLSFEYDTSQFGDVGGLHNLKRWLDRRKQAFLKPEDSAGIDPPKGIMLLGVQGAGKSLAAKAVAGMWHLPLLRMDFGTLYNKYHGETERNLREALRLAELMAPCVLWLDEIEKGLGTSSSDQGTSQRLLGTFLTWMAEREQSIFMVATANDIKQLPPELMRKGRMDEIFFVDLPDEEVRAEIFRIHLRRRDLAPEDFDLATLAQASDGFSGAEIEQAVVSAMFSAHDGDGPISDAVILDEIHRTQPLSVVMAERINALRSWAAERTVPA